MCPFEEYTGSFEKFLDEGIYWSFLFTSNCCPLGTFKNLIEFIKESNLPF